MSHLYLSAGHKSSGKTTLTLGLAAAFRAEGSTVQAFKKGPDYIDPLWLTTATGRACYNLDFRTQSHAEITSLFARRSEDIDLCLVEGNKGLHDGMALNGSDSNAAMAKLLGAPVVLVIDTRGMTRGVAPLLLGLQQFDTEVDVAGVVFNLVGGPRHASKLRQVVEHYTDIPVLGSVQRHRDLSIDERHLGLVPSNEASAAEAKIRFLGRAISEQVDLAAIRAIARRASPVTDPRPPARTEVPPVKASGLSIGILRDSAFGFYYPDDLERFRAAGAQLVFIDALHDDALPDIDGLFIGGGFPETHAAQLESNTNLRGAIADALAAGLPAYAECGGLMYLARSLSWQGERHEMVGVIPGDIVMHRRPVGRGYVRIREDAEHPWTEGMTSTLPESIDAHEFHHSSLENLAPNQRFAYQVERGHGIDGTHDGLVIGNLLAGYSHQRHVASNPWVDRFLDFVARVRGH